MFSFTKLIAPKPKVLSKQYDFVDAALKKTTAAALPTGRIETVSVATPEGLVEVLASLTHAEALMMGVPVDPNASRIVTRRMLAGQTDPGTIARTTEHFTFPEGGGFFFFDHDGLLNGQYMTVEEFIEFLYSLCPALREVKIIVQLSSSSHIHRTDTGEDLTGARGIHVYIPVVEARDIIRAGAVLKDLAWLGQHGFIIIAKNGNRLFRLPFDTAVSQANRIIFASGAICGDGLEQRRGPILLINPDGLNALDTAAALPSLDEASTVLAEATRSHARAAKEAEAEAVQATWMKEHRPKQLSAHGAPGELRETRETLITAIEEKVLRPDFVLMVKRPGKTKFQALTVSDVLADQLGFHRARTLDPIEPDYNGNAEVGVLFLDRRTPILHSQAHGGATYRLEGARKSIEIHPGEMRAATQAVIDHIRQDSVFYDYGGVLMTIAGGERVIVEEFDLEYLLGARFSFLKPNRKGELLPVDAPPRLLRQLLSSGVVRQLRPLSTVLTHPTITANGTLLNEPGYYTEQALYLDCDTDEWPDIQTALTDDEARALIDLIWTPFRAFPFVDAVARGALLAGLWTAILRASFDITPAFASDGPEFGAGKTLLLETIASIASGKAAVISPPFTGDESEIRKMLTSIALGGDTYLLLDNLEGYLHSPTLQAFLTGSRWNDRLLTTNRMLKGVSTRIFMGMTASNISFSGDLQRRVISWRIDPAMERGAGRVFDFCPKETGLSMRKEIIAAVLGLTLAAKKADLPPVTESLGSFTAWERVVRTTLRYIERLTEGHFADPVPRTIDATAANDDTRSLRHLHLTFLEAFGWKRFTAQDLLQLGLHNERSDISDALAGATGRSERLSSKSIGRYMRRFVDRPVWGLVLRVIPGQKALAYRLEPHAPGEKTPAEVAFGALSEMVGVPSDLYGRLFVSGSGVYRVDAIDRAMGNEPVIAEHVVSGDRHAFSLAGIEGALCDGPTSAG
jgi:hypothetical protein